MKITIKITKEVLQRSYRCVRGAILDHAHHPYADRCAIATALKDVFGPCAVDGRFIVGLAKSIPLPIAATVFVFRFDSFDSIKHCRKRLTLPEFSFKINVPEEIINSIGISELTDLIKKSPSLQLCETES